MKKYTFDFHKYKTMRSFGDSVNTCKANIIGNEENQKNLLKNVVEFYDKSRPRLKEDNSKNEILLKVYMLFMKVKN